MPRHHDGTLPSFRTTLNTLHARRDLICRCRCPVRAPCGTSAPILRTGATSSRRSTTTTGRCLLRAFPLLLLATFAEASAAAALPPGFSVLDPANYNVALRDDYAWCVKNVPFIDLSGAGDTGFADVETAFYYRWREYRKHLNNTPDGWVVTEFLPKVPWAGKDNTIPAAAGHHIAEGRWIHNATYLDDYITFWFERGGTPRRYTSWFAWAAWQRHMVVGNASFITSVLPDLLTNAWGWVKQAQGKYGGRTCFWQDDGHDAMEVSISGAGCRPTISSVMFGEAVALLEIAALAGNTSVVPKLTALREQARSVVLDQMWSEEIEFFAVIPLPPPAPDPLPPPPAGFSHFGYYGTFCCDHDGCSGAVAVYRQSTNCTTARAVELCESANFSAVCNYISVHNEDDCFLATGCNGSGIYNGGGPTYTYKRVYHPNPTQTLEKRPLAAAAAAPKLGPPPAPTPVCPGDGGSLWPWNKTVGVRELLGYMPWYFSLPDAVDGKGQLIPPAAAVKYGGMWRQLFDKGGFAGPWGLRTAERRSPCYNYSWSHHDCWNGPSWPYETARVLTSAAHVLNDGYAAARDALSSSASMLSQPEYVLLLQQYARQHTKTYANPDTADPKGSGHIYEVLHPDLGYWIDHQDGDTEMGEDYNHSTFIDLVLSGLFGLRPRGDATVVINPLLPATATHFAVDHVLYHGKMLAIVWDVDGSHYGLGAGLRILIDGKTAAHSATIGRLTAEIV